MTPLPNVNKELVEYLEKLFPDVSPSMKDEDRKIWFRAGQVDVVRQLRNILEDAHKHVL